MKDIVEEAEEIVQEWTNQPGGNFQDIAARRGQLAGWAKLRIRLLGLAPEIIQAARDGRLDEKQIRRLTTVVRPDHRDRIFQEMLNATDHTD